MREKTKIKNIFILVQYFGGILPTVQWCNMYSRCKVYMNVFDAHQNVPSLLKRIATLMTTFGKLRIVWPWVLHSDVETVNMTSRITLTVDSN